MLCESCFHSNREDKSKFWDPVTLSFCHSCLLKTFHVVKQTLLFLSTCHGISGKSVPFPSEQAFHTSLAGHALGHTVILSKALWKETLSCLLYKIKFQDLFSSWTAAFLLILKLVTTESQLPCWLQYQMPYSVKEAALHSHDSRKRALHHSTHRQLYHVTWYLSSCE